MTTPTVILHEAAATRRSESVSGLAATTSYRPEVDGLRAVAVVPVVLFHAGVPGFEGGFLGVDIFFVISGYLITSLIHHELQSSQFTFAGFYERRIRRIVPALYLVIFVVLLLSLFTAHPQRITEASEGTVATLAMVSNILFWTQSGYFGSAAETNSLLHTWSLSVEEQFYLLFPLLFLVALRGGKTRLIALVLVGFVGSLTIAEYASVVHPRASFFLAPSRAWEFLAGSLVALVPANLRIKKTQSTLSVLASLLCLVALLASFAAFDNQTIHPGLRTLVPVLATAGLLHFVTPSGPVGRVLASAPFITVGLLSYSIYLWHQPLFAFGRMFGLSDHDNQLPLVSAVFLCALTLTLAWLTWRFVERPFRDRSWMMRRQVIASWVLATTLLVAFAFASNIWRAVPLRTFYPENYAQYAIIEAASAARQQRSQVPCHVWDEAVSDKFRREFARCASIYGSAILITGDSHGTDLFDTISRSANQPFLAGISKGYCRAHQTLSGKSEPNCQYESLPAFVYENRSHIRALIYTQVADRLYGVPFAKASEADLSDAAIDEVISHLATVREKSGVPVVILGFIPTLKSGPDTFDFLRPLVEQAREAYDKRYVDLMRYAEQVFADRATRHSIPYISKMDAFEMKLPDDILVDGKPTYSDSRHLTVAGQTYFGRRLVKRLEREPWFAPLSDERAPALQNGP